MITRERLKELIEKGTSVRLYRNCGWIIDSLYPKKWKNYYLWDEGVYRDDYGFISYKDLFENIEDAQWHKEFGNIVRTERLELPTWEEFIEKEEVGFYQKYGKNTAIKIIGTKYLVVETCFERYYMGDLTKENYTLACRKAKELFLGDK